MRLIDGDALKKTLEKLWNVHDDQDFANKDVWREIENAPTVEPDNQVHLCGFCKYGYPECPAEMSDIIFGNGKGHDNVCACAKFEIKSERKKGKWSNYKDEHCCSVCKCVVISDCWDDEIRYDYCPYCGAEMSEGE